MCSFIILLKKNEFFNNLKRTRSATYDTFCTHYKYAQTVGM